MYNLCIDPIGFVENFEPILKFSVSNSRGAVALEKSDAMLGSPLPVCLDVALQLPNHKSKQKIAKVRPNSKHIPLTVIFFYFVYFSFVRFSRFLLIFT